MPESNRLLLFGAGGQLGRRLHSPLAGLGELTASGHQDVDFNDADRVVAVVDDIRPRVVVNAAAWTDVEGAETSEQEAFRVNAVAPAQLAAACARQGSLLIHFSSDYVFSGEGGRPWTERDEARPTSAYGRSKLAGDAAIRSSTASHYIFRAGWLYDKAGRNFLTTIGDRLARGQVARVVADQHGSPTWAALLAGVASTAAKRWIESAVRPPYGIYNVASADHTTWFGFAQAIAERRDLDPGTWVEPISSAEYGGRARRPEWSVLDSRRLAREFGLALPGWVDQLDACLDRDVVEAK